MHAVSSAEGGPWLGRKMQEEALAPESGHSQAPGSV